MTEYDTRAALVLIFRTPVAFASPVPVPQRSGGDRDARRRRAGGRPAAAASTSRRRRGPLESTGRRRQPQPVRIRCERVGSQRKIDPIVARASQDQN